jgi:hypothetical protein
MTTKKNATITINNKETKKNVIVMTNKEEIETKKDVTTKR